MDASEVWKLFFETHLILDIRATFTLKNPNCKNFWWNYNKSESYKPYLGNKEQKLMFLVVCQSDVHIEFDFVSPFFFFFRARSGAQIKLWALKIGRVEVNLSSPVRTSFLQNTSGWLLLNLSNKSFICSSKKVNISIPFWYFPFLIPFFCWNEVNKKSLINQ